MDTKKFVYRTTETKVVEKVIKPSEVYGPRGRDLVCVALRLGWSITAFRPPVSDEMAVLTYGVDRVLSSYGNDDPRFILEKSPVQTVEEVWS